MLYKRRNVALPADDKRENKFTLYLPDRNMPHRSVGQIRGGALHRGKHFISPARLYCAGVDRHYPVTVASVKTRFRNAAFYAYGKNKLIPVTVLPRARYRFVHAAINTAYFHKRSVHAFALESKLGVIFHML